MFHLTISAIAERMGILIREDFIELLGNIMVNMVNSVLDDRKSGSWIHLKKSIKSIMPHQAHKGAREVADQTSLFNDTLIAMNNILKSAGTVIDCYDGEYSLSGITYLAFIIEKTIELSIRYTRAHFNRHTKLLTVDHLYTMVCVDLDSRFIHYLPI